jgi:hypothetical protein
MKRTLRILSACLVLAQQAFAGSGGPDAFGYVWRDNLDTAGPVFNWIDLTTRSGVNLVENLSDDNTKGPFNLNFDFHYYWYDVDQFWVGSNGYIAFQNGQLSAPFPSIPNTAQPQNFVAAMASDLNFDGSGNPGRCYYWQSPSGDSLVVSWVNVPFWDPAAPSYIGSNSFQIILTTVDSSITFQYLSQNGVYNGGTPTYWSSGIENVTGGVGLQHLLNPVNSPGVNYLATPYAVKFYYPASTAYQALDLSCTYSNNPTNGGVFVSDRTPDPWPLRLQVKNTGNTTCNAFNVYSYVATDNSGTTGTVVVDDTVTQAGMAPQATSDITMTESFGPDGPGTYLQVSRTLYPGDIVPSNDSATVEIVVVDTTVLPVRLSFDRGTATGLGLNWQGGNGGAGMHFIPPFYPCKITEVHAYIQDNPNLVGFYMTVFDDNGGGGAPGTRLDSVYADPATFTAPGWVTLPLTTPIIVNNGGFYVAWNMAGEFISLGQDLTGPFSNRTYEVLSSAWAIYRSRETEDLLINATVDTVNLITALPEQETLPISQFYPNPASSITWLQLPAAQLPESGIQLDVFLPDGRCLFHCSGKDTGILSPLAIDVSTWPSGTYIVRLSAGDKQSTRRLQVMH